jgi:hypothetical protein
MEGAQKMGNALLWLFAGACVVVVTGCVTVRELGRRALRSLPPISDLRECSLRRLYLWVILAQFARLRGKRRSTRSRWGRALLTLIHARVMFETCRIGLVPTDAYRRWRIERVWMTAIMIIDCVIDGDLSPTRGTREEFFAYFSELLFGFGEPAAMSEDPMLEVVPWLYVVRACREMLGFDPIGMMREAWRDYSGDASRIIAGEPVADARTIERAHRAYVTIHRLAGVMLGLSEEQARLFAELDVPNRVAADIDLDWPRDARRGQLAVAREQLREAGISVEEVLANAGSLEALAQVRGLSRWYIGQVREHRHWLQETALPRLRVEVIPYLRPRLRRTSWLRQLEHRSVLFDRCERRWRRYAPADQAPPALASEPAGAVEPPADAQLGAEAAARVLQVPVDWRKGPEILAAAARALGIPVSLQTLKRWMQAWACTGILDRLLDDSEDREAALEVYRKVLRSLGAPTESLPQWVNPSVLRAVASLMSSLADTGSCEEVVELALTIGQLAPEKRASSRPLAYARLVRRENVLLGELMVACMSPLERKSAALGLFRLWCARYMTAWGQLDALTDLKKDCAQHNVSVKPSMHRYLVLIAYAAWSWTVLAIRQPKAFRAMIDCLARLRAEKGTPPSARHDGLR